MKIKTITCHEVYNYGATLQEYALLYYLQTLGHESQAIHYKPYYLDNHFNLWTISNPKYKRFPLKYLYLLTRLPGRLNILKKKKAFDKFSDQYINTDSTLYRTNKELKENLPEADAYICGSDQIWNTLFSNGKDAAFYLDFVPDNKLKLSYAASFATDEIADEIKPFVYEKARRLNAISVRETSAVSILGGLGLKAKQVLDPVFLIPNTHWLETFVSPISEKFIFVYDFESNPLIEKLAKSIALEKGYKIYTVNMNITYADKNLWHSAPDMFLSLAYHAEHIFTNSFHALAFSLIFEKQVCVINRSEEINTRMRDLLDLVGLNQYLIKDENDFNLLSPIQYEIINPILEKYITESKSFLQNNLSRYEETNTVCY
ncbi:MAG: polysaccharide pyruvyl transferase family protein [Dysgonomonas sp.]|nr:polysaccharide pyruvyl transferase family protein [Dysgonomonas sp.]